MALDAPKNPKHMVLTSFITPGGRHANSWRLPDSRAEELGQRFDLVHDLVQYAEDAKLDSIFFGDMNTADSLLEQDLRPSGPHEPVTTMAALAVTTKKIGLSGTISSTFSYPYQIARMMTGIDHLSNGRAGWNIVTSSRGMENFGYSPEDFPPSPIRYAMADEFLEICLGLWDSWSRDAVVVDRANGIWVDPAKLHAIDFTGEYFSSKGPLNMPRSPQGRPVLFQAGQSEAGMAFGIKYADAIYAVQNDMNESIAYMKMYEKLLREAGRPVNSLKVLPGIAPILGETQKDAEEWADYLSSMTDLETQKARLVSSTKIDLTGIDWDDEIPAERWDAPEVPKHAHGGNIRKRALELGGTLRDLLRVMGRGTAGPHLSVVGTPSKVADVMVEWFEAGACSGFNFNPPANNERGQLPIFQKLVPELQSRGYFREEYEGDTLRDHLGLSYPPAWDEQ